MKIGGLPYRRIFKHVRGCSVIVLGRCRILQAGDFPDETGRLLSLARESLLLIDNESSQFPLAMHVKKNINENERNSKQLPHPSLADRSCVASKGLVFKSAMTQFGHLQVDSTDSANCRARRSGPKDAT